MFDRELVFASHGPLLVITEYAERNNLKKLLLENRDQLSRSHTKLAPFKLMCVTLVGLARDVAHGMIYLQSKKVGIIEASTIH